MRRRCTHLCLAAAAAAALSSSCGPPAPRQDEMPADTLVMETKADSVAKSVYDTFGGPGAWASLHYLRFDFAGGNDTTRTVRAHHLWDRMTGDYRVEMPQGEDTMYVALFNVNSREGSVYMNGEPVDSVQQGELLERAYRRFINDSYWLLMPVKMFDPGVTRSFMADSSDGDIEVLKLSFQDVGLTPGDQYWVYVDEESGRVAKWAYHLQHHPPDHTPQPIEWTAYKTLQTPAGEVLVSERKVGPGFVIYTDQVDAPAEVADGAFTDPQPMLAGA